MMVLAVNSNNSWMVKVMTMIGAHNNNSVNNKTGKIKYMEKCEPSTVSSSQDCRIKVSQLDRHNILAI